MAAVDPRVRAGLRAAAELLRFRLSRIGERLDLIAAGTFERDADRAVNGAAKDYTRRIEGAAEHLERELVDLSGRMRTPVPPIRGKGVPASAGGE